ncbi:alpha/beta hydrolase [Pedobacter puniceum]|uniref:Prolyl oligopeptidase family serine peptidase n=1 Tax=Pedobacter puniceum TaxID=2666136 RepID=A0A7K0FNA6_9SPHI|nr:alpha/beta hydrolase [Pedobacter puniceum]MRX46905.1 prolyl oligopeptidase family serine peptidase [Pedobacter puniceum]
MKKLISKVLITFLIILTNNLAAKSQEVFNLYQNEIPNKLEAKDYIEKIDTSGNRTIISKVSNPQLIVFRPSQNKFNGLAVIICPGGSYRVLSMTFEGLNIAKRFTDKGITAFILKYRLPSDEIMKDKSIGPLQDAQQAIKIVRENADKFNINPNKIGIIGFSAGGHLAATAGTHFNNQVVENKAKTNLRPDFMALIYPVISFGQYTHKGSLENLLGANPNKDKITYFSNELQVTAETPPTFLVHANDDKVVPVENSINMNLALKNANVISEMHIYPSGGHGNSFLTRKTNEDWFGTFLNWLDLYIK